MNMNQVKDRIFTITIKKEKMPLSTEFKECYEQNMQVVVSIIQI
jgi:hypothetical protein